MFFPGAHIHPRQRILDAYDSLPWRAVGVRGARDPPKKTAGPLETGGPEFNLAMNHTVEESLELPAANRML